MKYMLLIYNNQAEVPQFTPEERQVAAQAWFAFGAEAQAAGVLLYNDGLAPVSDATTVRVRDGKTLIADGPFAETHEQLGGYYMLYFDERGVSRIYEMSLNGNIWKLWRNVPGFSQRFRGTFTDGGNTIIGVWEFCEDDSPPAI